MQWACLAVCSLETGWCHIFHTIVTEFHSGSDVQRYDRPKCDWMKGNVCSQSLQSREKFKIILYIFQWRWCADRNVWPFGSLRLLLLASDHSFYDNRKWFGEQISDGGSIVSASSINILWHKWIKKGASFHHRALAKGRKRKTTKKRKSQSFYDRFGILLLLRSRMKRTTATWQWRCIHRFSLSFVPS